MNILTKKSRSNDSSGFTIIETLVVLVIAGLFLLVVFEAIPALTRNSRNYQRKEDVQAILDAISRYELNNSGDFPADCGFGANPSCVGTGNILQYTSLSYYNPLNDPTTVIQIHNQQNTNPGNPSTYAVSLPALPTLIGSLKSLDQVYVYNYEQCDSSTFGAATTVGAGYNNVVALYGIETGSSTVEGECQQL